MRPTKAAHPAVAADTTGGAVAIGAAGSAFAALAPEAKGDAAIAAVSARRRTGAAVDARR